MKAQLFNLGKMKHVQSKKKRIIVGRQGGVGCFMVESYFSK